MINGVFTRYKTVDYSTGGGAALLTLHTVEKLSLVSIVIGGVGSLSSLKIWWSTNQLSYRKFFDGEIGVVGFGDDNHHASPTGGLTMIVPAGQPIRALKNGNISGTIHIFELE